MPSKTEDSLWSRFLKTSGGHLNFTEAISYTLAVLGCILIVILGFLVFYGSIARYFFSSPSGIVFEITGYIMYFCTFLAAPWLLKAEKHVSVEILKEFVFFNNVYLYKILSDIVCLAVSAAFFLFSSISTYKQYASGIKTMGLIEIPRYTVSMVIPICALLMVSILIIRIRINIQLLKNRKMAGGVSDAPQETQSS
jgi:TRAP-type C4-dicarboxylate transport system permease small subunit